MKQTSILCVEDDPEFLDILCRAVGGRGVVVGAPSSEAALTIFNVQPFGLVITDLSLPRVSGIDLIASIRRIDSSVPILVITGSTDREMHAGAISAGASACLVKPIELRVLGEVVAELIGAK